MSECRNGGHRAIERTCRDTRDAATCAPQQSVSDAAMAAFSTRLPIQSETMSAKIYYLRPFQRETLDPQAVEPSAEDKPRSAPKRPARNALPGGRASKWKRKLGGGAVLRDASTRKSDAGSEE